MAGCMQHLQSDFSQPENFPIFCNVGLKIRFGFRAENNWGSCFIAQIQMAAHKIRM